MHIRVLPGELTDGLTQIPGHADVGKAQGADDLKTNHRFAVAVGQSGAPGMGITHGGQLLHSEHPSIADGNADSAQCRRIVNAAEDTQCLLTAAQIALAPGVVFLHCPQTVRDVRHAQTQTGHQRGIKVNLDFAVHTAHAADLGDTTYGQKLLAQLIVDKP